MENSRAAQASSAADPPTNSKDESELRAAVQYSVIQLCAQADAVSNTKMSPRGIAALAELTFLYATTCLSSDLLAFCEHAGRRTVTEADVLLAARKIPDSLLKKLRDFALENAQSANETTGVPAPPSSRRKRNAPIDLQAKSTHDQNRPTHAGLEDTSSESDDFELLDAPRPVVKRQGQQATTDASDDSDMMLAPSVPGRTSKVSRSKPARDENLADTSDEEFTKPQTDLVVLPQGRRFRMGNKKKALEKTKENIYLLDSDEESSGDLDLKSLAAQGNRKASRVLTLLDEMSMDSVSEHDASKENDLNRDAEADF